MIILSFFLCLTARKVSKEACVWFERKLYFQPRFYTTGFNIVEIKGANTGNHISLVIGIQKSRDFI